MESTQALRKLKRRFLKILKVIRKRAQQEGSARGLSKRAQAGGSSTEQL